MSVVKTLLKNARQALDNKDNEYCIAQCQSALEIDPMSYNALVFSGLAHVNLSQYAKGEENYEAAIQIDRRNLLAWQGLLSLLEKAGHTLKYVDTASRVAAVHAENNDKEKCLKVINKAIEFSRTGENYTDLAQALRLILPVSPFFSFLEDEIPSPTDTYVELAKLLEQDEAAKISSAIAKGRSRLGVNLAQLTSTVKNEIYNASQLEDVYGEIINWSLEESVRRDAETKLLSRAVERLQASPPHEKAGQIERVLSLAQGMTIVKVAVELAWQITLNWNDFHLSQMNIELLTNFTTLFTDNLVAQSIKSFVFSQVSPFSTAVLRRYRQDDSHKDKTELALASIDTVMSSLMDAREAYGDECWLLCNRILLFLHVEEKEWSSVIEVAQNCIEQVRRIEATNSVKLNKVISECNYHMALAMTFHRAPRFHGQALDLLEGIIHGEEDLFRQRATIQKATLLRLAGQFVEAQTLLSSILQADSANHFAQLEMAQCDKAIGNYSDAEGRLHSLITNMAESGDRSTLASIFYLVGECQKALKSPNADIYASYIQSLRYDPNHASTYTAIGLYYADMVGDYVRAEKCFQKALELDSAQLEAAERLASSFADSGDWELVSIIAQRVIQGNESLRASWPHKALGFVYLNLGRHQLAVTSFQSGLRLATKDADAWIGLGEAYLELGRYSAAEKAFGRASLLQGENWYARYLGATVASALGEHESACATLEELVQTDASNGIKITLCLSYMAWAKHLIGLSWFSKATSLTLQCLNIALDLAQDKDISAYDLIGQAATFAAKSSIKESGLALSLVARAETLLEEHEVENNFVPAVDKDMPLGSRLAHIACKAYLWRLDNQKLVDHEQAVLWSYIGNAMHLVLPFSDKEENPFIDATIEAYKCAVQLQPANDVFWSALGVASAPKDLPFSQHCLIKAVVIDPKSAIHWANLGYLYLKLGHLEAANQAFMTAQTTDPAYALAWLGQACIAHTMGESDHELFEHALLLGSASTSPSLAIQYCESVLRQEKISSSSLISATWALEQAKKANHSDAEQRLITYLRLLLLEQQEHDPIDLIGVASDLADTLEAAYDTDESDLTLSQYCDAKALLARLMLASKRYQDANDAATSVLELEPAENAESVRSGEISAALAQYHLGEESEGISTLTELWQKSNDNVVLHSLVRAMAKEPSSAISLVSNPTTPVIRLVYAALVSQIENPSEEQISQAQSYLDLVLLEDDSRLREQRNAIERILFSKVAFNQIHYDPLNTAAWLSASQAAQNQQASKTSLQMALHGANKSGNIHDLALVCRLSSKPSLRATSLHLAPQQLQ